jgi:uncharacterized protein (TIGR03083 family)
MEAKDLIVLLERDSALLADAAELAPQAPVPPCPEWNMPDLVGHIGGLHRWVTAILHSGARVDFNDLQSPPPASRDAIAWLREGSTNLVSALGAHDPDETTWTFSPSGDRRVWWWVRRQALETATHRHDAQSAASAAGLAVTADPADPHLAVEGVDEFVFEWLPRLAKRGGIGEVGGTLHLHATDVDGGEWHIDLGASPPVATREHAKADTALRGSASDLWMWLWNRLPDPVESKLDVHGKPDVVAAWKRVKI